MEKMIIDIGLLEDRVAIIDEQRGLIDFRVEAKNIDKSVNNVYLGKVMDVLPGMNAAFVDIGHNKNAYLSLQDAKVANGNEEMINEILKKGQEILVQVTKESLGEKGPKISRKIGIPGRNLVFLPFEPEVRISRNIKSFKERQRLRSEVEKILPKEYGVIIRTAAEDYNAEDFEKELQDLLRLWENIKVISSYEYSPKLLYKEMNLIKGMLRDYFHDQIQEVLVNDGETYDSCKALMEVFNPDLKERIRHYGDSTPLLMETSIISQLSSVFKDRVWLKSGGYIVIDKTEALTVIDVNTGKNIGIRDVDETVYDTNYEAALEIGKQIRLRNISGMIVIDFIDMSKGKHYNQILTLMKHELEKDPVKTKVLGFTKLGLMELTRKRSYIHIDEYLKEPCDYCIGKGYHPSINWLYLKLEGEILLYLHHRKEKRFRLKLSEKNYDEILKHPEFFHKVQSDFGIEFVLEKGSDVSRGDFEIGRIEEESF